MTTSRRRILRFLVGAALILLVVSLLSLTPLFANWVEQPLMRFNAILTHWSLGWIGIETALDGHFVHEMGGDEPFGIEVIPECTGIFPALILLSLTLSFPVRWSRRISGLAIGLLLIFAMNWLRLVTLFLLGKEVSQTTFEEIHVYVWQGAFIVIIAFYWYWWAQRSLPRTQPAQA